MKPETDPPSSDPVGASGRAAEPAVGVASVACPECDMPKGVWCVDAGGRHRDWPDSHGARFRQLDPVAALEDAERDVPAAIRKELLACAQSNGRISYHWLCRLYKRGVAAAPPRSSAPVEPPDKS
jgi:hypothetical protein